MNQEKTWFAREKIKAMFDDLHNKPNNTIEYWHYTSVDAVLSIFKEFIESEDDEIKKCNLYASHNRLLNDSQEYEDGKRCLKKFVKRYNRNSATKIDGVTANTDANAYIISFCTEGDLLSQWKWYGGESGISFCLNASMASFATITDSDEEKKDIKPFLDCYSKPLPVFYFDDDKKDYFDKLVSKVLVKKDGRLDTNKIDLLPDLFIPFCKNHSFYEEKEHRLVFFDFSDLESVEGLKRKFNYKYNKASNGVIKPALNVNVELSDNSINANNSGLIGTKVNHNCLITKMMVGPGSNQHLIFNGLIHIFDRNNFEFVPEINASDFRKKDIYVEGEVPADGKQHLVKTIQINPIDPKRRIAVYRVAYRCQNGLLIMKSAIPFRG